MHYQDKLLSSLIKEDVYNYCLNNVGELEARALKGQLDNNILNF